MQPWLNARRDLPKSLCAVVAQVLGGIVGASMLYLIASGKAGFDVAGGLASNGYGDHSPGLYSMGASFVTGFAPIIGALIAGNGYRWLGRGK